MASDVTDSLARARREHTRAVERGDDPAARLIAQAVRVLEQALAGELIPGQPESAADETVEPRE